MKRACRNWSLERGNWSAAAEWSSLAAGLTLLRNCQRIWVAGSLVMTSSLVVMGDASARAQVCACAAE